MKKRIFSLFLALACVLSLSVPALAADDAFTDAKDIQHLEAVTAVVKLGLMTGKEDGSYFDPTGNVTRGAAAKMMALILTGRRELTFAGWDGNFEPTFPDIRGHWAEAYIETCAEKGAAFPQEDGNFDPNGNVTFYELLRMAEIALGRQQSELANANNWVAVVHSIALNRNLLTGLGDFQGKAIVDRAVTRDETAQILYNALNATPETLLGGANGFYESVKRPDGTPSTLLYERYGFNSWAEVPELSAGGEESVSTDPTKLTDAARIEHWEAVAALCKLGVVNGKDDGGFHPEDTITRAEAAKLIAVLMNGGKDTTPEPRFGSDPTFSDTRGHWAERYIEYCADLVIIGGRGDGFFDPDAQVTGLELVKMALVMLGHDAEEYGLTGPQWAERADQLARYADPSLYGELDSVVMTAPINRDDAAQILYNALQNTTLMVAPGTNEDGKVVWQFKLSGHTLLKERFNLDSVGALPVQPK